MSGSENQSNPDDVVRKPVIPETQPTAEHDDVRSPKKDRDVTSESTSPHPVEEGETVRRLITPDDLKQQERGDDDRSPKKDRDLRQN